MYGSSLHVEVFCLAQPSSVKSLSRFRDLARTFLLRSLCRCSARSPMDSPSQRQASLAHADPSTRDTLASPHGSSSEVQRGRELLSNLAIDSGRPMRSPSLAPNMERRGVVAPSDGFPVSIMMQNNV